MSFSVKLEAYKQDKRVNVVLINKSCKKLHSKINKMKAAKKKRKKCNKIRKPEHKCESHTKSSYTKRNKVAKMKLMKS